MNLSQRILSDITVFNKYARYLPPKKRREVWEEICGRNMGMHIERYPMLEQEIRRVYKYVLEKMVLPSMRSIQFAGKAIRVNNSRIFNCSFAHVDDYRVFQEIMFLLLGGTGVGYSVQQHHVEKLPEIRKPVKTRRYVIGDSIEGWADAIKMLVKAYLCGRSLPLFVYDQIRPKGSRLVTAGGKAPGPEPLRKCLVQMQELLDSKHDGDKLTPLECHDLICIMADAVLAGGIRRAALISLFSIDDQQMMQAKCPQLVDTLEQISYIDGPFPRVEVMARLPGKDQIYNFFLSVDEFDQYKRTGTVSWNYFYPWRARSNNSVVAVRSMITEDRFRDIWETAHASGSGEPGIFLTNNAELGTNPCGEVAVRNAGFCNLTTINMATVESQQDLEDRVRVASFLGTLQAGYTDFHYLRDLWKRTAEKEALLGISMTGIAMCDGFAELDLKQAAQVAIQENERVAEIIGINAAHRLTCVKPEGTSSCVLGTTSGIHAAYWYHYIRRMRVNKDDPLYMYLRETIPSLVADEEHGMGAVLEFPQKCSQRAIVRTEPTKDMLARIKHVYDGWVLGGHREGHNTHNISATVYVRDGEWGDVIQWLWANRDSYNGITVMPYDGGSYIQAPFEECSEEEFERRMADLTEIDLTQVTEFEDRTELQGELACAGGACTIDRL